MDMTSTSPAMPDMTHYMELLASNQPWNLIFFMAIPVILAEFIAVTELYILFSSRVALTMGAAGGGTVATGAISGANAFGTLKRANGYAGILAGFYFVGVFIYLLFNAVIPITAAGEWRGIADVVAVGFYLLGVVPLLGMALLELRVINRKASEQERLKLHAICVGIFLVVAHIAMIFGMLNPNVLT